MTLVFAVMHLYNILEFFIACPFLFYTFLKSGIDKSTEWSTIPVCPSLMCFFNRGNTEGANSWKILFSMFVYVLCKFVLIFFFFFFFDFVVSE